MTIELRDQGAAWTLAGRATTFRPYLVANAAGEPGAIYREVFEPAAFDSTVSGVDKVDLRVNHDQRMRPLASTDEGTLRFTKDDDGVMAGAALSKTRPDIVAVVQRVQSKELRGLSVGMIVTADRWGKDTDGVTEKRWIQRAEMRELSIVERPMNPFSTITDLRRENRGNAMEYRFFSLRDATVANSMEDPNPAGTIRPPNLRDAMDASVACQTCAYYDNSQRLSCSMFSYAVQPTQLCDEWENIGDDDSDDAPEGRGRVLLENDSHELLYELWRLRESA